MAGQNYGDGPNFHQKIFPLIFARRTVPTPFWTRHKERKGHEHGSQATGGTLQRTGQGSTHRTQTLFKLGHLLAV